MCDQYEFLGLKDRKCHLVNVCTVAGDSTS